MNTLDQFFTGMKEDFDGTFDQKRKLPISPVGKMGETSTEAPWKIDKELEYLKQRLTTVEKRALESTWAHMQELPQYHPSAIGQLMCIVFEETMDKTRHKHLFFKQGVSTDSVTEALSIIPDHGRKLQDFIEKIIAHVNDESSTTMPSLTIIGECHQFLMAYGMNNHIWETFGETLTSMILGQSCVHRHPYGQGAWNTLIVSMIDGFKAKTEITRHSTSICSSDQSKSTRFSRFTADRKPWLPIPDRSMSQQDLQKHGRSRSVHHFKCKKQIEKPCQLSPSTARKSSSKTSPTLFRKVSQETTPILTSPILLGYATPPRIHRRLPKTPTE